MAMDIISKDKKEIQWKGLPRTSLNDIEELKVSLQSAFLISCIKHLIFIFWLLISCYLMMQAERLGLRNRIEKKAAYLQELEEQV